RPKSRSSHYNDDEPLHATTSDAAFPRRRHKRCGPPTTRLALVKRRATNPLGDGSDRRPVIFKSTYLAFSTFAGDEFAPVAPKYSRHPPSGSSTSHGRSCAL